MADPSRSRISVVAGLGYVERVRELPPSFQATLVAEPDNRYFQHAIAVVVNGAKVGYVAPEIATNVYDAVKEAAQPITCPGRCALPSDHGSSGVELLLDFSPVPALSGS
jgi:hypothetical protein